VFLSVFFLIFFPTELRRVQAHDEQPANPTQMSLLL
jgi:hypothetical protein